MMLELTVSNSLVRFQPDQYKIICSQKVCVAISYWSNRIERFRNCQNCISLKARKYDEKSKLIQFHRRTFYLINKEMNDPNSNLECY
ncbi:MAG: hypothetical protein Ta2E_10230 [Mycoplasmoidaceae bacterium]|nr:MAG: hypothetical protein Ta2E_10230 [Mycoplasmoidaceae bacterium]